MGRTRPSMEPRRGPWASKSGHPGSQDVDSSPRAQGALRLGFEAVTPRIRCARCLPVIRRPCLVICLRVAFLFMSTSAFPIMSSCASHLHTCSSHASEHFPRCPFCNPTLLCLPAPPFGSFRVRVLNFLGMDRDLPSGLDTPPVDRLSSFVPFGVRLILQRLIGEP